VDETSADNRAPAAESAITAQDAPPATAQDAAERYGPLAIVRTRKDDGRALIYYYDTRSRL